MIINDRMDKEKPFSIKVSTFRCDFLEENPAFLKKLDFEHSEVKVESYVLGSSE